MRGSTCNDLLPIYYTFTIHISFAKWCTQGINTYGTIFNKNMQVVTSLLTSSNNLLQQADIRMRSHALRQLVTTSLLQVVNRPIASCQQICCKFIISTARLDGIYNCSKDWTTAALFIFLTICSILVFCQ